MAVAQGEQVHPAHRLPERRYRPELHGLRGLAIALVVLFHLFGGGRVSGGIDVFLAVSGFLFTGMLLRESVARGGPVDAGAYLGRLARRLLPPLLVVVPAVTALGLGILPAERHVPLLREAAASLLYVENWELVRHQLAYEAAGPATSPFQHVWSLAVQGQFYLLWPLLTMLSVGLARWMGLWPRAVMIVTALTGVVGSFWYAVWLHGIDPTRAYLDTGARLWELGVGALLALVGPHVLPLRWRPVAGWLGLMLVVTCGFALDGAALFPGPWALWPVLGFVLVMLAEHPASWGVTSLLQHRVFAFAGDISYALYLWHWPLLVLWLSARGLDRVGPAGALLVLTASVLLAWATHLVERRVTRLLAPWPVPSLVGGLLVVGIVAGGLTTAWHHREEEQAELLAQGRREAARAVEEAALDEAAREGARASETSVGVGRSIGEGAVVVAAPAPAPGEGSTAGGDPIPALPVLALDQPDYYDWPCRQLGAGAGTDEVTVCDDPAHPAGSPGAGRRPTVLVTGGSHAGQWVPALRVLAKQEGWRVLVADKSGCQLTDPEETYPAPRDPAAVDPSCLRWNASIVDVADELDPDLVLTIGTTGLGRPESTPLGMLAQLERLEDRGMEVVTLRDTPRRPQRMPDCLARVDDPAECDMPRVGPRYGLAAVNPWLDADPSPGIPHIDLSELYCPGETCPAVIDGVITYRDASHLSSTFVTRLAPALDEELRRVAPQLYQGR